MVDERHAVFQKLLTEHSTHKHHMYFYDNELHNHYAQGLIAVYNLGGSVDYMHKYTEQALKLLYSSDPYIEEDKKYSEKDLDSLISSRQGYHFLLSYYEKELKTTHGGDYGKLLHTHFPKLYAGMAGGALHGVIHAGLGVVAKSGLIVCEGLALLHHSFLDFKVSQEKLDKPWAGKKTIGEILAEVRNTKEIADVKSIEGFGYRMKSLPGAKADLLLDLVNHLDIGDQDLESLQWCMVNTGLTLWAACPPPKYVNDFFLLHALTGGFSVSKLLPFLPEQDRLKCVKIFTLTGLAVYVAQGSPELDLSLLSNPKASQSTWEQIEEIILSDKLREEHYYKAAFVARELARGRPQLDGACKAGAFVLIDNDKFTRAGEPMEYLER